MNHWNIIGVPPEINACFLLFLGFAMFIAGLGNVVVYDDLKPTGLSIFLIVFGIFNVILGGIMLHQ